MSITAKSYGFVAAQFTLIAAITMISGAPTSNVLQLIGLLMLLCGFVVAAVAVWQLRNYSLTALPTPISKAKLLQAGLYKRARHPIYAGLILAMVGVVLSRYSVLRAILLACLIFVLYQKSIFEEQQLIAKFGNKYKEYQSKTRRFL